MALYEDIQKIASTRQSPNARFRSEFIRSNMQNPGGFYKQFGADLNNPMGGTQSFTQPTQQLQTMPESSFGNLYNNNNQSSGGSRSNTYGEQTDRTATGGLFGNSPAMGGLIGTGLGALGVPMSGVLGQAVSGTPGSLEGALQGTMKGMGASLLANELGLPTGLVGMGINSLMSGKLPGMGDIAMSAALSNPATAVPAALYSAYKNVNSMMGENYRNNEMYGLTGNPNTWGAPTIGSTLGFSNTNQMKNEDGTGLSLNPAYGLGFNPVGLYGNVKDEDMGMLGTGITPRDDRAYTMNAMEKLGLAGLFNTPEQQAPTGGYAVGGNTYGAGEITSGMYGTNPDVYGPPQSYNGWGDTSSSSNYGSPGHNTAGSTAGSDRGEGGGPSSSTRSGL